MVLICDSMVGSEIYHSYCSGGGEIGGGGGGGGVGGRPAIVGGF